MTPAALHEFAKHAISAGRTLAAIEARATQGVRVAPRLLQGAREAAGAGLTSTPAAVRRTALGAASSGAEIQRAAALPQRVGLGQVAADTRARVSAADVADRFQGVTSPTRMTDPAFQLSKAHGGFASTPEHRAQVFGITPQQAVLKPPTGLSPGTTKAQAPVTPGPAPAGTVPGKKRPVAPAAGGLGTAKTVPGVPMNRPKVTGFEPTNPGSNWA